MDSLSRKHIKRWATRRNTRPRSMPAPMPTPRSMPAPMPIPMPIVRTAPMPILGVNKHPLHKTKSGVFYINGSPSSSSSSSKSRKIRIYRPPLHPNTYKNKLFRNSITTKQGVAVRRKK